MKRSVLSFIAIIAVNLAFSQTPMQFKYQAVLRDASGNIIANQQKTVVIEILQGSTNGSTVFTETHNVSTTVQGNINLNIGSVNTTGLSTINWAINTYFIKITIGGVEMGTSQLLSVPYALYAQKAGNGFSGIYNDLTNKPTLFSGYYSDLINKPNLFNGNYADLTNKPSLFDGKYNSLSGVPTFATVATSGSYNDLVNKPAFDGSWNSLTGKPILAAVATSGSYIDLSNKPTLFDGDYYNLINKPVIFSGNYADLTNKPGLFDGKYNSLTGVPTFATVAASGNYNDLINKPAFDGSWNSLTGKPTLAAIATSGSYTDLSGKPTIFDGNYNNLTNKPVIFSGNYVDLTNKPALFDGKYSSLIGAPALSSVATTGNYNDLQNKPALFDGNYSSLIGKPTLATIATSGSYADLSDKPTIFDGNYNNLTNKPNLFSGNYADLTNKPLIFDGKYSSLSEKPILAQIATSGAFSDLIGKPSTLAGYGILDAASLSHSHNNATTITSGYLSAADKTRLDGLSNYTHPATHDWSILANNPFSFTTPVADQLLKYNGTKWINFTADFASTNHSHSDATTTASGFISKADKTKLDGIAAGAEVNVNADWNATSGDAQILNKPKGNNVGDMLYWNGTAWVNVQVGQPGQFLRLSGSNIPEWSGAGYATLLTSAPSQVGTTTASIGGIITNDGGASILTRGVCFSTSPNPTISNNKTTDGTGTGSFTSSLVGLIPLTTYYAKAYATNRNVTSYGNEVSFTTVVFLPTVVTSTSTSTTSTTISCSSDITENGGGTISARGVCWSTTPNPTITNNSISNGNGEGSFSSLITDLTYNTTYYIRAYATNQAGTAYGNELTVITKLAFGQFYQGGLIVRLITDYLGNEHGIIVTPEVFFGEWGCNNTLISQSTYIDGKSLTPHISSFCSNGAAKFCETLNYNGYDDWYLPSVDDLIIVFRDLRITNIMNLGIRTLWTSTYNFTNTNDAFTSCSGIFTVSNRSDLNDFVAFRDF